MRKLQLTCLKFIVVLKVCNRFQWDRNVHVYVANTFKFTSSHSLFCTGRITAERIEEFSQEQVSYTSVVKLMPVRS